jgi:LysR family transcriptional regulator, chromosome initiation inhibitor
LDGFKSVPDRIARVGNTFEAVARLGTAHAAAAELNVTQTAITQRIKALESGISITLFLRSRRGMKITDEGKALLQYVVGSRELEGQFLSLVQGRDRNEVSLRLVGPTSAISTRIAENLEPLYSKFPFLRLHLRSDDHGNRVEMLRRGEVDLAVIPPEQVPNELDSKLLKPDRYLLIAAQKWRGRRLSEILDNERIIDFDESDKTTFNYLKTFELLSKRERIFINENEALIRMFLSGVGFGTLTESVAAPYLENGKLITLNRGQSLEDPLALVWYPRPRKMEYFEAVIRSIK